MVYQLKITLRGIKDPTIWRRILVPSEITFDDLHRVIQSAMGWENDHLYSFGYKAYDKRLSISLPTDYGWDQPSHDATRTLISDFINPNSTKLTYVYDFGDDWIHNIELEKVFEDNEIKETLPYCLKAQGECPPEDCGGPWAYEDLKYASIRLSRGEKIDDDLEERLEWYEVPEVNFIRKKLEIETINERLRQIKFKKVKKAKIDPVALKNRIELIKKLISGIISRRLTPNHMEYCEDVINELVYAGVDITCGRAEIWAAALVVDADYTTFIDEDPVEFIPIKEICDYFNVKEKSMQSRLRTIRKNSFDEEREYDRTHPFDMCPPNLSTQKMMQDYLSNNPDIKDDIAAVTELVEKEGLDPIEAIFRVISQKK